MTQLSLWICVASITSTAALAACVGTVSGSGIPGPAGSGGSQGSGAPSSATWAAGGATPGTGGAGVGGGLGLGDASPPAPIVGAIAITAGQLGMVHCGSSASCDPATLFLELGVPSPSCADPQPAVDFCGSTLSYHVSIGIPPALLQPATLSLSNPALFTFFNVSGGLQSGACGGGGGSFSSGYLTLVSIDEASVTFTLSGGTSFFPVQAGSGSVDGTYVATRCP
jgi:hypothetical protein